MKPAERIADDAEVAACRYPRDFARILRREGYTYAAARRALDSERFAAEHAAAMPFLRQIAEILRVDEARRPSRPLAVDGRAYHRRQLARRRRRS